MIGWDRPVSKSMAWKLTRRSISARPHTPSWPDRLHVCRLAIVSDPALPAVCDKNGFHAAPTKQRACQGLICEKVSKQITNSTFAEVAQSQSELRMLDTRNMRGYSQAGPPGCQRRRFDVGAQPSRLPLSLCRDHARKTPDWPTFGPHSCLWSMDSSLSWLFNSHRLSFFLSQPRLPVLWS